MPTINYYGQDATASSGPQYLRAEFDVSPPAHIQIPTWAKRLRLGLIGGGGGSGSGARGLATANGQGGSTGSGGGRTIGEYNLPDLMAYFGLAANDFYYLPQLGPAGTSGASVSTDNTDGNAGTTGGTSYFRLRNNANTISKVIAQACGGSNGQGGRRAAGTTLGGSLLGGPCTFPGAAGVPGTNALGVTGLGANESCGSGGSGAGFFGTQALGFGDIGAVPTAGTFAQAANSYTISGTGNLTGNPDSLAFAWTTPPSGDFDWICQPSFTAAGIGASVGIMVRDGLATNAAFFGVQLSGGTASAINRSTTGAAASSFGSSPVQAGLFLRLSRVGTSYTASYGTAITGPWTTLFGNSIAMTSPRLGFFIASVLTNTVASATIANLSLTANGGAASATGLGSFGLITGSVLPGANAPTVLPPGVPGLGGGGGQFRPGAAGLPGGNGYRGGAGGGGAASQNGFLSGAGGIPGNGYAFVELFSY
jgi:hypothetical protein